MSTPYSLTANKAGEEKFVATVVTGGEVIASFEAKSVDEAVKLAKAYASQHNEASKPAPLYDFKHDFHL